MRTLLLLPLVLLVTLTARAAPVYDPLATVGTTPTRVDLTARDQERARDIPLRVYLPDSPGPSAVVLFSHGLGGSREGCVYLGEHWAKRGYVAVFLQHPGSDESVWKDQPAQGRRAALERAASPENLRLRVEDVSCVLDQLEIWNREAGHPLKGRLDLTRVGMSGHSFGAVTTQAVSGESFPLVGTGWTDPRIQAALALSPSAPRQGGARAAFSTVRIPWMLMTGTEDRAVIGAVDAKDRQAVYPALPPGHKYELVLNGAEHSAFTDRALPGDQKPRNPNHHRAVLALSTAFWDAYLNQDPAARAWLDGSGARQVLQSPDRWQRK